MTCENFCHLLLSYRLGQAKKKSKSVRIDIPPGVDNGMTLKVGSQGEEGLNGLPPGDLFVTMQVSNDSYFRRDGEDLIVDIPITVSQVSD